MAQFSAYYPDVIVQGGWMLAFFNVFGDPIGPMAARYGLVGVQPDQWYPQQPFLDALRDTCPFVTGSLFDIGQRMGDLLNFPEEIDSVEAVLTALEYRYHLHHRNDDRSHWRIGVKSRHTLTCVSSTPYPSEFEQGVVTTLARRYRPKTGTYHVSLDLSAPTRKSGADSCTYHILWSADQTLEAVMQAERTAAAT